MNRNYFENESKMRTKKYFVSANKIKTKREIIFRTKISPTGGHMDTIILRRNVSDESKS